MPECRKCKARLVWKQPYKKGDRPVGRDGLPHVCATKQKVKTNWVHCEDCYEEYGWVPDWKLKKHREIMHPNGERYHPSKNPIDFIGKVYIEYRKELYS